MSAPPASNGALSSSQHARIRTLSTPRDVDPTEASGELNIVPFLDIITNVSMFVLASIAVSFTTKHADAGQGRQPARRAAHRPREVPRATAGTVTNSC